MVYYQIKQKNQIFGSVVWQDLASYASKRMAFAKWKQIKDKENFKLVEVTETEISL